MGAAGWAVVHDAVDRRWRGRLLAELDDDAFLALPDRIGGTRHLVDELAVPVVPGDGTALGDMGTALREAVVAAAGVDDGLADFAVNQAVYLRYRGPSAGIGPHVDGKCYALLVAVLTLRGSALFSVLAADGSAQVVPVGPGDLCLLRAPGFRGEADGRPRHTVGPPGGGAERIALTLRMRARMGPLR